MKTLLSLLACIPVILASCVNYGDGTTHFNAIGMDAKRIELPGKLIIEDANMSGSFKAVLSSIEKMWRNYLMLEGLKYMADQYYTLEGAKVSAASTARLEELRNAKSAADAAAALEQLKLHPPEALPAVTTSVLP